MSEAGFSAFERYAPFIQDYIYESGWQMLRGVQNAAADAIFTTEENVLLTASTASGKTEAAFFPILTLLDEEPPSSVGALYIAPLKALINDQFERLNDLCEQAHIPVTKWHGDASQAQKRKLLRTPAGILQITPESLESLLLNKHMEIPSLFHDLRFIVIDEVHSLLRGDRGLQTFSLIERLCALAGCQPRRVGLSATIGDPEAAGRFISAGSGSGCIIPSVEGGKDVWRLSMEHFYTSGPQAGEGELASGTDVQQRTRDVALLDEPTDSAPAAADPGAGYIFEHTRGKKCLIFTNSREECEAVCQQLRQYCEARGEADRFLIHHGNLSASYRESAEEEMKDDSSLQSICATATLELGIDVGRLERAFQLDAPFTVSGFLQRMGRTGRRGDPSEMWFVMREDHQLSRAMLPELIPWYLLQGIALVQLYVEERFVEPPRLDRLPYSLLYHQTMSTLASSGEMTPAQLASRVLTLSCFARITQDDFRVLLRHLVEIDHIMVTENGGLIVGLAGERVVNNYKFYAVFQENVEYSVRSGSEELGTIVKPPPVGDKIAIAGRVWAVDELDHERHIVYCTLVKGRVPAYFGDTPGDIHTRILEKMYEVLREDSSYPYLMRHAGYRLAEARTTFDMSGMERSPLINLGGKMWVLFPWLGSYAFLALERFLKVKCGERLGLRGLTASRPYYIQFTMEASRDEFFRVVTEEAAKTFDPLDLVDEKENPVFEKYDPYVPAELVRKGFAYGVLDVDGMRARVAGWAEGHSSAVVASNDWTEALS
ncbi:DEAD/DEAH box helicase [Alloscardovia macacae]|uniref:ATP-dependent helicase n=1 Tax=Alloscardovia macacae TaxID=1160091 RepID=A0A261F6T8_9BIFI|nr:DEAD/DEAH box helicase [Alloscardovia macacae]OZG54851.1 ATP-dependent helicase [Alloscardovia macacae]